MLSRAQEARVQAILWSSRVETHTYCLEHLATAAKIPLSLLQRADQVIE